MRFCTAGSRLRIATWSGEGGWLFTSVFRQTPTLAAVVPGFEHRVTRRSFGARKLLARLDHRVRIVAAHLRKLSPARAALVAEKATVFPPSTLQILYAIVDSTVTVGARDAEAFRCVDTITRLTHGRAGEHTPLGVRQLHRARRAKGEHELRNTCIPQNVRQLRDEVRITLAARARGRSAIA